MDRLTKKEIETFEHNTILDNQILDKPMHKQILNSYHF